MSTTKSKITTTEKRANALCESIRHNNGGSVTVEWIKSATWGRNPRIMHHGEKCTNISGCGYCKHSAALASALCYLGTTEEERRSIARTQGVGVSSVLDALAALGWKLDCVESGKSFYAYTLSRATVPA
jgi:hypothetical protein